MPRDKKKKPAVNIRGTDVFGERGNLSDKDIKRSKKKESLAEKLAREANAVILRRKRNK